MQEKEELAVTEALSGRKILVVEDVPINLKIAAFLLENMGFVVTTAGNGAEAVEVFSRSAEGEYTAIFMDVMMPVLDGLEATKIIRKMDRADAARIPIVAVTADALEEERGTIVSAGMNGCLLKPLTAEAVNNEIMKYL